MDVDVPLSMHTLVLVPASAFIKTSDKWMLGMCVCWGHTEWWWTVRMEKTDCHFHWVSITKPFASSCVMFFAPHLPSILQTLLGWKISLQLMKFSYWQKSMKLKRSMYWFICLICLSKRFSCRNPGSVTDSQVHVLYIGLWPVEILCWKICTFWLGNFVYSLKHQCSRTWNPRLAFSLLMTHWNVWMCGDIL